MSISKLKQKAIAHYDRMIQWAETLSPVDQMGGPDSYWMMSRIGVTWYNNDCSFCSVYTHHCKQSDTGACCPLRASAAERVSHGSQSDACCNGLWIKMARADTWVEWLEYARLVRNYINNVEEK